MEAWKDVPGYVGLYQVSNEGRVRSLVRLLPSAVEAGERREKKVLKLLPNRQGRLRVFLSRNGEQEWHQVHRLVLEAFVGPCPEGLEACHFPDRNPENNRLENLRWDTREANRDDQRKHGTIGKPQKLGWPEVRAIRASEDSGRVLAARYGVSQPLIVAIRKHRIWVEPSPYIV